MRIICIIIFSVLFGVSAVRAEVAGRVSNSDNEPIQGASVALLALPDSTYIAGTISHDDGYFVLTTGNSADKYLLRVQAFGYEPANVTVEADDEQRPVGITLQLAATELGEVVVRGKAPVNTREGNKFIFIPNDLVENVTTARNMMNYVPLVIWEEREVTIWGKGKSIIYINGKDPRMTTQEVSAMLRTLDPRLIKRIEIITEPGAVQAAEESGGIINIILDDPTQGLRGTVYENASVSNDNPSTSPYLWLAYQKGKFKSSINLSYGYGHNYTHNTDTYRYGGDGRTVVNESRITSFSNSVSGRFNLSYDINPRNTVGAQMSLGTFRNHGKSVVNTMTAEDESEEDSKLEQTTDVRPDKANLTALAYYTLMLDNKGSMVDVVAGYNQGASHTETKYVFSGDIAPQKFEDDFYSFAGKADYVQVFGNGARLRAGLYMHDVHMTKNQTLADAYDHFKYEDRQMHAYAQFEKGWGEHFYAVAGLRVENTHTRGRQLQGNEDDKQTYTDLVPSLSMSWRIPEGNQSVALIYKKRIGRPQMGYLNPYKTWTSDNTYSQGNPYLKPSYTHDVLLNYSCLSKFVFGVFYSYTSQILTSYTLNTPEGFTATSFTNSGHSNYVNINANFSAQFFDIWHFSAYGSAGYKSFKIRAEGQDINTSGWNCTLLQDNNLLLSRKHLLMCTLSQILASPNNHGTYKEGWRYKISLGLQKDFAFGLETRLDVDLPITGYSTYRTFDMPDYSYELRRHEHVYSVSLTLSYTFGKKQVSGASDRSI